MAKPFILPRVSQPCKFPRSLIISLTKDATVVKAAIISNAERMLHMLHPTECKMEKQREEKFVYTYKIISTYLLILMVNIVALFRKAYSRKEKYHQ